jgi:hypothetical protein
MFKHPLCYWRRADEARAKAVSMRLPEVRALLLDCAVQWEDLAEKAEWLAMQRRSPRIVWINPDPPSRDGTP